MPVSVTAKAIDAGASVLLITIDELTTYVTAPVSVHAPVAHTTVMSNRFGGPLNLPPHVLVGMLAGGNLSTYRNTNSPQYKCALSLQCAVSIPETALTAKVTGNNTLGGTILTFSFR